MLTTTLQRIQLTCLGKSTYLYVFIIIFIYIPLLEHSSWRMCSVMVRMQDWEVSDPGSIPGGKLFFFFFFSNWVWVCCYIIWYRAYMNVKVKVWVPPQIDFKVESLSTTSEVSRMNETKKSDNKSDYHNKLMLVWESKIWMSKSKSEYHHKLIWKLKVWVPPQRCLISMKQRKVIINLITTTNWY